MKRVIILLLSTAVACSAQVNTPPKHVALQPRGGTAPAPTTPPANPEPNKVQLTLQEKSEILEMQRDLEDAEVQAFSIQQKLTDANKETEARAKAFNTKLDELRTAHGLPHDAFFNQKDVYFITPPKASEKEPEKK